MSKITVPEPLSPEITLRWFVEYIVDNSPLFKTASAVAKAGLLFTADLDTVGGTPELNEAAHKLLRAALTSEEQALEMPTLYGHSLDEGGKPIGEPMKLSPRLFGRFIAALLSENEIK